jgi:hypothetical protein
VAASGEQRIRMVIGMHVMGASVREIAKCVSISNQEIGEIIAKAFPKPRKFADETHASPRRFDPDNPSPSKTRFDRSRIVRRRVRKINLAVRKEWDRAFSNARVAGMPVEEAVRVAAESL